jgi:predicted RNA methylase
MPYSYSKHDNKVEDYIKSNKDIKTIIDFGAGAGKYGKIIKKINNNIKVIAVEVWEENIHRFNLSSVYDEIICGDLKNIEWKEADLAIFGDVIEHFYKEDSLKIIDRAKRKYKKIIIVIPIGLFEQGAFEGNPFEEHKSTWEFEELCELLSEFDIKERKGRIGLFIKK